MASRTSGDLPWAGGSPLSQTSNLFSSTGMLATMGHMGGAIRGKATAPMWSAKSYGMRTSDLPRLEAGTIRMRHHGAVASEPPLPLYAVSSSDDGGSRPRDDFHHPSLWWPSPTRVARRGNASDTWSSEFTAGRKATSPLASSVGARRCCSSGSIGSGRSSVRNGTGSLTSLPLSR